MDFLPWTTFDRIVQRYSGNHHVRTLRCSEQYRAMSFAQLTYRESLRDIETCLAAQAGKLYQIGFRAPVRRSTLADANERRDWRIYADFAQRLIIQARKLYAGDSTLAPVLGETVYALDSTTIDLCLSVFPWASFRATKGAVKMHTLLDLCGPIPSFIHISDGKLHQPFFGSLALRLPIRADETRETLASDGKDIRYAPQWVADTDADHIKTALARVVLACALKHHTRRGGRDPERWQRASQLVTHGLLRDAGFVLSPETEAWDSISAEQAYDRLPEPPDDGADQNGATPSGNGDGNGSADDPQPSDGGDDQNAPSDPTDDGSPQDQDKPGSGSGSASSKPSGQAPGSHDPCGTGEVMDADKRRDDATGQSGESPVNTPAEEQAWDEAMHQAASLARAQGNAPGAVEETIRQAHRSILDWRSLLRRYMTDAARRDYSWSVPNRRFIDSGLYLPSMHSEGIDAIAIIIDTSASLPGETLALFWAEVREIAAELQPDSIFVLQVDAVLQDAAEYSAGGLPDSISIKGRGGTDFRPGFAWLHEHGVRPGCCLYLTDMECDSFPETPPLYPVAWCVWGSPHGDRYRKPWGERIDIGPA